MKKNYCNRILIVKVIVENAVTCFWDTVYVERKPGGGGLLKSVRFLVVNNQ